MGRPKPLRARPARSSPWRRALIWAYRGGLRAVRHWETLPVTRRKYQLLGGTLLLLTTLLPSLRDGLQGLAQPVRVAQRLSRSVHSVRRFRPRRSLIRPHPKTTQPPSKKASPRAQPRQRH